MVRNLEPEPSGHSGTGTDLEQQTYLHRRILG